MSASIKIALIIDSLRKETINRQVVAYIVSQMLAAPMRVSPEVYLSDATDSLTEGRCVSARTQPYLQKFIDELVKFVGSASA
ncbi:hypothetical protein AAJP47_03005 [Psychrobacter sp. B38]|uniref:hypothetical protein n=1 Tax=Psychrobacter sp. B38 TaxID=3143538 RepID=UPI0032103681